ncbi:TetR/AcrR family transcriptional regulator [Novosphingobium jiangmenense]|uniref:TetR/AcrR family transcriptional regulator n=1 Tax=Novosphingobium jiangmenense TaxID=2791981 RepID=A0ABS0HJF5_9SPHN|nr:TetR/AcrR family transcriptional regulator [Novosphingobium jiangmenense]MBF9152382.1 TetR/AcrR family transcriptional regulator [Novosphingobium jiangmenense]
MEGSEAFSKPLQNRSRESLGRIVRSAVKQFSAKGIDATRVADIVGEAGVPVGTFYKHFADKEALLTAIIAGYRSCRMREITALCTSPVARAATPREIVQLHLNIVFTAFTVDAGLLRLIERMRLENPDVHQDQSNANDTVAALVADLLVEKLPDRDPEQLRRQVLYAHSIIRGAVVWSVLPMDGEYGRGLKVTDGDFASEALEMALRYLRIES